MSRNFIPTREQDKYQCVVGYDPPLDTLFAQVINLETERREEERAAHIAQVIEPELSLEEMDKEADDEREPLV